MGEVLFFSRADEEDIELFPEFWGACMGICHHPIPNEARGNCAEVEVSYVEVRLFQLFARVGVFLEPTSEALESLEKSNIPNATLPTPDNSPAFDEDLLEEPGFEEAVRIGKFATGFLSL